MSPLWNTSECSHPTGTWSRLILSLLLALPACDGHLVAMDIKEQRTAQEKAHRHISYSCGESNVVELVQTVAKSLNLIEQSGSTEVVSQNKYEWRSSDGHFMLSLQTQGTGLWRLELLDWPNSSQSELSTRAEAEIRKRKKSLPTSAQDQRRVKDSHLR